MIKYELDKNDSIKVNGHTLYRVVYTDEFIGAYEEKYGIFIDKKGGWIESEKNLSQDNYAVVINNSKVHDNAEVSYNAKIYGNARVYGDAVVHNAKVYGNATIRGKVSGSAEVYGYASVQENEIINGHRQICH